MPVSHPHKNFTTIHLCPGNRVYFNCSVCRMFVCAVMCCSCHLPLIPYQSGFSQTTIVHKDAVSGESAPGAPPNSHGTNVILMNQRQHLLKIIYVPTELIHHRGKAVSLHVFSNVSMTPHSSLVSSFEPQITGGLPQAHV